MSVQAEDLIRIAQKVLDILGVAEYSDLQLIQAVKDRDKWKASFTYEYPGSLIRGVIKKTGSYVIDAESGEIEGMWLDRSWK